MSEKLNIFKGFQPQDPDKLSKSILKVLGQQYPDSTDFRIEYVVREGAGYRVGCEIDDNIGDEIVSDQEISFLENGIIPPHPELN